MGAMVIDDDRQAARLLALQADEVGYASGREPLREALQWISRGRLGRRKGWPVVPILGTPWQDTISDERFPWRMRSANLNGALIFSVDYEICLDCRLGWVELPRTEPRYQRCGLAAAGLAALRAEKPGLAWHTLGGHEAPSRPFWAAVGANVPGGYQRLPLCPHTPRGG
jgi:hypothetical protein